MKEIGRWKRDGIFLASAMYAQDNGTVWWLIWHNDYFLEVRTGSQADVRMMYGRPEMQFSDRYALVELEELAMMDDDEQNEAWMTINFDPILARTVL